MMADVELGVNMKTCCMEVDWHGLTAKCHFCSSLARILFIKTLRGYRV
jgi:hypothetical protein